MRYMLKLLAALSILLLSIPANSQIKWTTPVANLTPEYIDTTGSIMIGKRLLNGSVSIYLNSEEVYFKDNQAIYKLEQNDFSQVSTPYGTYTNLEMFSKDTKTSLLKAHRAAIYK